jgi:hypothetical protein
MEYERPQQYGKSNRPQRKKVLNSQPEVEDLTMLQQERSTFNVANIPAYPSSKEAQGQSKSVKDDTQPDIIAQANTENPYEKMSYGDKLTAAMQMVPGMLEGELKELFYQLINDPKFAAAVAAGAVTFAALQFTPAGPAINLGFTIAFGLKAGVEIGEFFYRAFQAKDEDGIKAAAESLKNAVVDGGPLLVSGLAGGFKTLNGLLMKLKGGKAGVKALQTLTNLSDDAQEALRLLKLTEQEISKIAEIAQKQSKITDDLLRQFLYKMRKAERKNETFQRPANIAQAIEDSIKNYALVMKRGYPFGFKDINQFKNFGRTVEASLERYKIPTSNVGIHGSAVHKSSPGDLDIAIVVDNAQFKTLGQRFIANSKMDNIKKGILKDMEKGKISSQKFAPVQNPTIGQALYNKAGNLKIQVSLIRRGSEFDVGPYLPLK